MDVRQKFKIMDSAMKKIAKKGIIPSDVIIYCAERVYTAGVNNGYTAKEIRQQMHESIDVMFDSFEKNEVSNETKQF